jgi:hypothetical protein
VPPLIDNPGAAEAAILTEWQAAARWQLPPALIPSTWPDAEPGARIAAALGHWTMQAPLPLIVFLDEIDTLQNDTLISVLRQLRSGYARRPQAFPHALALIGLRVTTRSPAAAAPALARLAPSILKPARCCLGTLAPPMWRRCISSTLPTRARSSRPRRWPWPLI